MTAPDRVFVRADARRMPFADGVAHMVVTSPPYFGLRAYDGKAHAEIGREQTPAEYVAALVEVMRDVRRVLRDDGVCFLNLGDSYGGTGKSGGGSQGAKWAKAGPDRVGPRGGKWMPPPDGLESGNALMIPHRVAMALQDDGWIVRMDAVWGKANCMPESVSGWAWTRCRVKVRGQSRDSAQWQANGRPSAVGQYGDDRAEYTRPGNEYAPCPSCPKCRATGGYVLRRGSWRPTRAHEMVFMLAKSPRYFSDGEGVREAGSENSHGGTPTQSGPKLQPVRGDAGVLGVPSGAAGRNARSVLTLASSPSAFDHCARCSTFYAGADRRRVVKRDGVKVCPTCNAPGDWVDHFALMPPRLVAWCLRTGPAKVCGGCGAPWARVVEKERDGDAEAHMRPKRTAGMHSTTSTLSLSGNGSKEWRERGPRTRDLGFRPTCACDADPAPPLVLDPFTGGGTTAAVAAALGWRFAGTDLSARYLSLARARAAWAEAHPERFVGAQENAPDNVTEIAPQTERENDNAQRQLALAWAG